MGQHTANTDVGTDLTGLQQLLWAEQSTPPKTMEESLARVSQSLLESIQAFQDNQLVTAQTALENTFAQTLLALKVFEVDPNRALARALNRLTQEKTEPRRFKLYDDFVEIYVGSALKGGWLLHGQDDHDAAVALAQTFGCLVEWSNCKQLSLFDQPHSSTKAASTAPTKRSRQEDFLGRTHNHRPRLRLVASNHH